MQGGSDDRLARALDARPQRRRRAAARAAGQRRLERRAELGAHRGGDGLDLLREHRQVEEDLEGGAGLRVLLIADAFGEERVGLHAERAAHPPHERQLGVDDVDPAKVAVADDRLELVHRDRRARQVAERQLRRRERGIVGDAALAEPPAQVEQPLHAAQQLGALLHPLELRHVRAQPVVRLAALRADAPHRRDERVDALVAAQHLRLERLHRVHLGEQLLVPLRHLRAQLAAERLHAGGQLLGDGRRALRR